MSKFWMVLNKKNLSRTFESKDAAVHYAKTVMGPMSKFVLMEATDEIRFMDPPVEVVPITVDEEKEKSVEQINKDTDEMVKFMKGAVSDLHEIQEIKDLGFKDMFATKAVAF